MSKLFFPNNRKLLTILICLQLFLIMGLRDAYSVGVDMGRYAIHYSTLSEIQLFEAPFYDNGSSALYYLANAVFSKIGISFQLFISCVSAFIVGIVGRYVYKYSDDVVLSFALYLGMGAYTFAFSGIRQAIAMAIILLCVEQFFNKNYYRTYIYLILAVLFHTTAIIILPFLLISKIKISNLVILFYFVIGIFFVVFRIQIGQFITLVYQESYIGRYRSMGQLGGTALFLLILLVFYFYTNSRQIRTAGSKESRFFHSLVISFLLQSMASFAYTFTRLNLFYMQTFLTLIFPESLHKNKLNKRFGRIYNLIRIIIYIVFIVIMINQFYGYISGEQLDDYIFFWER